MPHKGVAFHVETLSNQSSRQAGASYYEPNPRTTYGHPVDAYGVQQPEISYRWPPESGVLREGRILVDCYLVEYPDQGITFRVHQLLATYGPIYREGAGGAGTHAVWGSTGGGGMTEDAAAALRAYLENGYCSPGWDIFVDGTQVCFGSG